MSEEVSQALTAARAALAGIRTRDAADFEKLEETLRHIIAAIEALSAKRD